MQHDLPSGDPAGSADELPEEASSTPFSRNQEPILCDGPTCYCKTGLFSPARPVRCFDSSGKLVGQFCAGRLASAHTGVRRSSISNCANGLRPSADGFTFEFANAHPREIPIQLRDPPSGDPAGSADELPEEASSTPFSRNQEPILCDGPTCYCKTGLFSPARPVRCFDSSGKLVGQFCTGGLASAHTGVSRFDISKCAKWRRPSADGFTFEFADVLPRGLQPTSNEPLVTQGSFMPTSRQGLTFPTLRGGKLSDVPAGSGARERRSQMNLAPQSKYLGVSWDAETSTWCSTHEYTVAGARRPIERRSTGFKTEEEAALSLLVLDHWTRPDGAVSKAFRFPDRPVTVKAQARPRAPHSPHGGSRSPSFKPRHRDHQFVHDFQLPVITAQEAAEAADAQLEARVSSRPAATSDIFFFPCTNDEGDEDEPLCGGQVVAQTLADIVDQVDQRILMSRVPSLRGVSAEAPSMVWAPVGMHEASETEVLLYSMLVLYSLKGDPEAMATFCHDALREEVDEDLAVAQRSLAWRVLKKALDRSSYVSVFQSSSACGALASAIRSLRSSADAQASQPIYATCPLPATHLRSIHPPSVAELRAYSAMTEKRCFRGPTFDDVEEGESDGANERSSDAPGAGGGGNGNRITRFFGVCWHKEKGMWEARVQNGGNATSMGFFDNQDDAARAYDVAAEPLGCPLNFAASIPVARSGELMKHYLALFDDGVETAAATSLGNKAPLRGVTALARVGALLNAHSATLWGAMCDQSDALQRFSFHVTQRRDTPEKLCRLLAVPTREFARLNKWQFRGLVNAQGRLNLAYSLPAGQRVWYKPNLRPLCVLGRAAYNFLTAKDLAASEASAPRAGAPVAKFSTKPSPPPRSSPKPTPKASPAPTGARKERKVLGKGVVLLDDAGKVVRSWDTQMLAEAELGISVNCIGAACRGDRPTAKGFRVHYFLPPGKAYPKCPDGVLTRQIGEPDPTVYAAGPKGFEVVLLRDDGSVAEEFASKTAVQQRFPAMWHDALLDMSSGQPVGTAFGRFALKADGPPYPPCPGGFAASLEPVDLRAEALVLLDDGGRVVKEWRSYLAAAQATGESCAAIAAHLAAGPDAGATLNGFRLFAMQPLGADPYPPCPPGVAIKTIVPSSRLIGLHSKKMVCGRRSWTVWTASIRINGSATLWGPGSDDVDENDDEHDDSGTENGARSDDGDEEEDTPRKKKRRAQNDDGGYDDNERTPGRKRKREDRGDDNDEDDRGDGDDDDDDDRPPRGPFWLSREDAIEAYDAVANKHGMPTNLPRASVPRCVGCSFCGVVVDAETGEVAERRTKREVKPLVPGALPRGSTFVVKGGRCPVVLLNTAGHVVAQWSSISRCALQLGLKADHVTACVLGRGAPTVDGLRLFRRRAEGDETPYPRCPPGLVSRTNIPCDAGD